jgi:hypothetical protein
MIANDELRSLGRLCGLSQIVALYNPHPREPFFPMSAAATT